MTGCIKSVRPLRQATESDVGYRNGRRINIGDLIDGYCFIAGEDHIDRFAHRNALNIPLNESLIGLYVEFEPALRAKGACAVNVRFIAHTPAANPDPVPAAPVSS